VKVTTPPEIVQTPEEALSTLMMTARLDEALAVGV
jgi:hypothetical protein